LTKFPDAFTSQIEDKRALMEEKSFNPESGTNSAAGSSSRQEDAVLPLVLNICFRAVADREARPGLR